MNFLSSYHTEIGENKQTNQDGLLIKSARTNVGNIGLFAVCDGMGGLSAGELASSTVISGLSDWFDDELPKLIKSPTFDVDVKDHLTEYIHKLNQRIASYGISNQAQLGTTLSALLIVDSIYYTIQVGDSRVYAINQQITQLTADQSLVARELARGTITEQEAVNHPNRHVLLQCIGVKDELDIVITSGIIEAATTFLLCTDGFHNKLSDQELFSKFHGNTFLQKHQVKTKLVELVDLLKQRQETDDITVIAIQVS